MQKPISHQKKGYNNLILTMLIINNLQIYGITECNLPQMLKKSTPVRLR